MNLPNEVEREAGGLKLHLVKTEKYKTNTLVLKLKAPLESETVTLRALLPYVLQSGTKNLPSSAKLRSYLDELYGASLSVDLTKKGEYHIISFRMEIANEKFLSDPAPLLNKGIALIAEVLQEPALQGNTFVSDIVEKEKRTLKQRIQSVYDDKMRYSNLRLVQEMCKGEPYALHVNGEKEQVDEITAESLYTYYQRALNEDEIDLYIIGDINEEEVADEVNSRFSLSQRPPVQTAGRDTGMEPEGREVFEEQDIKQGKLNIGYRTYTTYSDKEYDALQVYNGVFGGFSHSKLFKNVREKESLAYYAASRLESHKGLLMVMSGIEFKNYEKAVTIIKEQHEAMKNGDFTDNDISQTKAVIRNQLLETIDTSHGLVEVLYHNVVSEKPKSLQEWLDGVEAVTKEQIVSVAAKIKLDTIYFLKGLEAAE